MVKGFGSAGKLDVHVNQKTLEHELFAAGNEKLLKLAFLAIHRNSKRDWETRIEGVPEADRPDAFIDLIKTKRTRKGDLAQEIAARIAKRASMRVPDYLEKTVQSLATP
jgi:putative ATP-dependent endonuclease of OLD family